MKTVQKTSSKAKTKSLETYRGDTSENFGWLTEHSRRFLSAGYLSDGETPEARIRDIADNAEKILKIPGFSDKFYNYMSKGYYSLASPVWSNF